MEDIVREMHTRSGLLDAITASNLSLEDAGAQTLEFIRAHVPESRTVPLCGNSIGTDRRFLAAQLPEIENWLHYRSVDVSALKELCRRWYPKAFKSAPPNARPTGLWTTSASRSPSSPTTGRPSSFPPSPPRSRSARTTDRPARNRLLEIDPRD